jgi:hypothetical protein
VVPCAAGGSLMFAPEVCVPALREMHDRYGDKIYGRYGFIDAFNPTTGWVNTDYIGIDGDYVDHSMLKISPARFQSHELSKTFNLTRKFDLVISLEVAEHIDERSSDTFVESLIKHGDVLLFSAAIPGQGGQLHLNEQWPEYWQEKFARHGFYFHDVIRPEIWANDRVDFWYRQNMFLITKEKPEPSALRLLSVVHPELYKLRLNNEKEYQQNLVDGKQGLRVSSAIFFNAIIFKLKSLLRIK